MIDVTEGTAVFYAALVDWREARGEQEAAQVAVCFTIVNRRDRGGWWGTTVDEIATKRFQYSSMTDPNDKQLTRWPLLSDATWITAWRIARSVLSGSAQNPVEGADSYFDDSMALNPPAWAKAARFCGKIGRLNFYDVDHDYEAHAIVAAPAAAGDFQDRLDAWIKAKG